MADESEERGFTIVDKRGAGSAAPGAPAPGADAATGAAGESAAGAADAPGEAAPGAAGAGADAAAGGEAAGADTPPLPPVDFTSFALSLGTSALYHLGLVANPSEDADARNEPNLPVARHTIDTLELLQQKTQGNLSEQESALLSNLLSELRLRFVEVESRAAQQ